MLCRQFSRSVVHVVNPTVAEPRKRLQQITRKHNQQNERTRACTHTHTHTHTRTHAGRSSLSQHDAPLMSGVSSDCSLGASESHERFEGESESSFSSPACSRRAALLWTSLELALGRVVFVAALKNFMRPFVWARRGKNEENALALARDPGSMRLHCWRAHSGTTSFGHAIFLYNNGLSFVD